MDMDMVDMDREQQKKVGEVTLGAALCPMPPGSLRFRARSSPSDNDGYCPPAGLVTVIQQLSVSTVGDVG